MSEELQPAQTQEHQPGAESEMSPAPEYMPRYPGVGKLRDKVALISGGDSGIGRAVAVAMAREGARIAISYLDEHEDAKETVRRVEAESSTAIAMPGDIGEEAICQEVVAKTIEAFGRLDILVNNAAEQHPVESLTEITAEQLERTFKPTSSAIST